MHSQLNLKLNLIEELSEYPSVVFVGGTSEYLQGFRNDLNDIDISIKDPSILWSFGYVFRAYNSALYGLSGNRASIRSNDNILIDIFVDDCPPDFIIVKGKKCETIESMLELSENTKIYNKGLFSDWNLEKLIQRIKRLESYKKATRE